MRTRIRILGIAGLALAAGCMGHMRVSELEPALHRSADEVALAQAFYEGNAFPFFEEYCISCHGDRRAQAGINLLEFAEFGEIGFHEGTWRRVLAMVESGQMPPENRKQPSDTDRQEIAAFLETELDAAVRAMRPDPGRVTARRLNRQEYDNTVRDLFGIDSNPARVFPVDDSGYGFDNIGDVLTISPLLMEKYLTAAEAIAAEAIANDLEIASDDEDTERRILVCGHDPDEHIRDCARTVMRHVASRAYRRPASGIEVTQLADLVGMVEADGGSFAEGVELALQAVLVSPHFLFRIERDRRPRDPEALRYVNNYELASRLSYFLWSSMPDDELFELAASGTLRDPEVLPAQVERMIGDAKAWAFVENFAGQWLELRNLDIISRDRTVYPEFNSALRNAMRKESELFFDAIFREDQSVLNFIDADFTFVNETLAKLYGIDGIEGGDHQRVSVDGVQRGGVLTQASVLTLTSFPARTSPVLRGAWVMENILGTPPPPPPEDVPALEDDPEKLTGTLREQLEMHRANPTCASCHNRIDPLGFGLENYDGIGRWRTEDLGKPVDSSGVLPNGVAFEGSKALREILLGSPDDFVRNLTEKMLTYALGRGLEPYDRPVVAEIVNSVTQDGYGFHALVQAIVQSVPFQMRRGEEVHRP